MGPDAKNLLTWVPAGGALGGLVERLVAYLAESEKAHTAVAAYLGERISVLVLHVIVAGCVTLVAAILLDINRQNQLRMFATGFLLGTVWPSVFEGLLKIADNLQTQIK